MRKGEMLDAGMEEWRWSEDGLDAWAKFLFFSFTATHDVRARLFGVVDWVVQNQLFIGLKIF